MIPDYTFFGNEIEKVLDGKTYAYDYKVLDHASGSYIIKFSFISSSAPFHESLDLTLCNYKGRMWIDGNEVKLKKHEFQTFGFEYGKAPQEFTVKLEARSFEVVTISCSVTDDDAYDMDDQDATIIGPDGLEHDKIIREVVCVEPRGNGYYRIYCNDHECDDDFDDLIVDMYVSREE